MLAPHVRGAILSLFVITAIPVLEAHAGGEAQPIRRIPVGAVIRSTPETGGRIVAREAAIATVEATCGEVEPNEQPSQASPASVPGECSGNVSANDASSIEIDYGSFNDGLEDLFVLNLAGPAQLKIELTYSSPSADLDLFLFTVSGNTIHFIDGSATDGSGKPEMISLPVAEPPGTYYIGVSSFSGSSPYTLKISAPGYSDSCTPTATSVCLNNGRFRVTADWQTSDGQSGSGRAVLLTHETAYFWFFSETNVEVVVKLLDACGYNGYFWVFSAGLTNVRVVLTVTDTLTGATKSYTNPLGTNYAIPPDVTAFSTCNPGCSVSVSPTSQQFSASGGTGSLTVTAGNGCPWNATSNSSWLTINSGSSGSGNGSVGYTVAANATTSQRTGTITVGTSTATITQAAGSSACTYTVTPTSQQVGAAAGSGGVTVTAQSGCSWNAASNVSWLTITSGASGSGNGNVGYSHAENTGTSSRSGTMTIAGKTVTITQLGAQPNCTFAVPLTSKSFTWCGGDASTTVTTQSDCSWTSKSNAPWITEVILSDKGTGSASFSVAANTSGSSRQGTVTIAGQTVTVTQAAQSGGGSHDGLWSGMTDGNRPVEACVASDQLQMLRITVRLTLPGLGSSCTTKIVRLNSPVSLSGNDYAAGVSAYPEISNVFTTVNGSFPSATTMSGSWGSFSDAWYIFCGSSIAFGTGGTTLAAGSFTATKQ
ncbi:MAG: pre-peptidase C-terminal domain-containing protein [Acidobacteria bacterium]|nr:pre-peptidase C-terminal domain-containing protein [Acidobacteriota bacterium]